MNNIYKSTILRLAVKNQLILSKAIDMELFSDVEILVKLDEFINLLFIKNLESYDFVCSIRSKKTLFLGEGNFSFSLSILKKLSGKVKDVISTVFEEESEISKETLVNSNVIKRLGAKVLFGINATKLEKYFGDKKFENIIFQFPNVGSRDAIEGRNPNFILLRDFLKSSYHNLENTGIVIISVVNSSYYDGVFSFEEAAKEAGFLKPEVYKFDPDEFAGYNHTMTNDEDSAIEGYESFKTLVFRKNI